MMGAASTFQTISMHRFADISTTSTTTGQIRSCGLLAEHDVTAVGRFHVRLLRIARLRR